jgi:hypothetical protein
MTEYQLRGADEEGNDTGQLVHRDTLEEAMEEFLSGRYWKLSWTHPDGQRIRFIWCGGEIQVIDPNKWADYWRHLCQGLVMQVQDDDRDNIVEG